ncbi:hypothetical protein Aperf_G00000054901 [Anoplocephala perfoliata]
MKESDIFDRNEESSGATVASGFNTSKFMELHSEDEIISYNGLEIDIEIELPDSQTLQSWKPCLDFDAQDYKSASVCSIAIEFSMEEKSDSSRPRKKQYYTTITPIQLDSSDGRHVTYVLPSTTGDKPRVYTFDKYKDSPTEWLKKSIELWSKSP